MPPLGLLHGRPVLLAAFAVFLTAPLAAAQPNAYVLGYKDDVPGPPNSGVQVLTVINTATNTKVGALPLELGCFCVYTETLAITPDGSRLYAANPVSGTVSVVDTATLTIAATLPADTVGAVLLNGDGTRLFVLDGYPSYRLTTFDTATHANLGSIPLGAVQTYGMDITPDGRRMYVSTYGGNSVKVVDLLQRTVIATIPVGQLPVAVEITPDGSAAYVGNIQSNTVSVISTATDTVVATLAVGEAAGSIRAAPDGARVYVAGRPVTAIDIGTRMVSGTVPSTSGHALGFTPDGARGYVAATNGVQAFSTATHAVTATIGFNIATEGSPRAIAIVPAQPLNPPSEFEVSSIAGNLVTFRWTPSAQGARPTHFTLEGGVAPGQVLASIPTAGAHSHLTVALPTGSFYVRVHAVAGTTRSGASNEIRVHVNMPMAPSPPADVIAGVQGSQVTLAWRNTFDGGVASALMLEVTGAFVASFPLGFTDSVRFDAVPPGTYTLRLRATNASGASGPSTSVTIAVPGTCASTPLAPTRFTAYHVGGTLYVRWDRPANGPAPSSYVLDVSGAIVLSVPTVSRALSGTVPPGTYRLSVASVNACGVGPRTPTQLVTIP